MKLEDHIDHHCEATDTPSILDTIADPPDPQDYQLQLDNPRREITAPDCRTAAVAKMRQLADLLENGTLDGVRIQWREGLYHIETVERDDRPVLLDGQWVRRVRLLRYELITPDRPANPPEPMD